MGRRRCVRRTVTGYSWNSPAEDQVTVRKRGMPGVVTFAWYVDGRKVASNPAPIEPCRWVVGELTGSTSRPWVPASAMRWT
jgi:hypothetical protein